MKCFYHPQSDAVGICKNCNKGLCQECAVDVGNGIACKDSCETEVKALNEAIDKGKSSYKKTGGVYVRNAIIFALLGFVFLVFGLIAINTPTAYLMIPIGIICLLAAGFNYSTSKKIVKK